MLDGSAHSKRMLHRITYGLHNACIMSSTIVVGEDEVQLMGKRINDLQVLHHTELPLLLAANELVEADMIALFLQYL